MTYPHAGHTHIATLLFDYYFPQLNCNSLVQLEHIWREVGRGWGLGGGGGLPLGYFVTVGAAGGCGVTMEEAGCYG